jgi:hypothetical protein
MIDDMVKPSLHQVLRKAVGSDEEIAMQVKTVDHMPKGKREYKMECAPRLSKDFELPFGMTRTTKPGPAITYIHSAHPTDSPDIGVLPPWW